MPEYLSERKRKVSVGIPEYTENNVVLDITGSAHLTTNLGIGTTNPTSRITFGTSSLGTLPSQTSLRLYDVSDQTGNLVSYGFGVNDDSDLGLEPLKYFDFVVNDESTGGIRFFVGNPAVSFRFRERVSIGTDVVSIKNAPVSISNQLNVGNSVSASSFKINGFEDPVIDAFLNLKNISGIDQTTSDTISLSIANNPKTFSNLDVDGTTRVFRGPFLFGSLDPTGTENQLFEVNTGAYFSGSLGIGVTNTKERLSVSGNILLSNIALYGSLVSYTTDTNTFSIHSGLSTSQYRFVEYSIQASQENNYQFTKILGFHDGTEVFTTQYGDVYNNFAICEYTINIVDNDMCLLADPLIDSEIKYSISFIATKIE